MQILILGAGALGGYFGARLLAAGRDVSFLVRPNSAALLAAQGLRVSSPHGDLALSSPATVLAEDLQAAAAVRAFDLILLGPKAYDLPAAMEAIAPAAGPETSILPILNGMAHMALLDARFGRTHVLGGSSNISAARDADGRILHLNRLNALQFGDRDQPASARIQKVAEALSVPNLEAQLRPTILEDMWWKWTAIACAAGVTCLLRAAIGDIVAAGAVPLVHQLLGETLSIAAHEGFPLSAAYIDSTLAKFTQAGSLFTASMLRDLQANGPIESHQIIGDLLHHARRNALSTPLLEVVYAHLRCYEERRSREAREKTGTR